MLLSERIDSSLLSIVACYIGVFRNEKVARREMLSLFLSEKKDLFNDVEVHRIEHMTFLFSET